MISQKRMCDINSNCVKLI